MSLKKTNDAKGYMRGAGPYSKDYAKFDGWKPPIYESKDILDKIEGVGDYETDRAFTGEVSKSNNHPSQGRYSTRGDGRYSPTRSSGVGKGSGKQGNASGGQKISD